MVLLKHLNEGIAPQGVTQDAQITPGCCDVTTSFRARQNLLHQIILQLKLLNFDIVRVLLITIVYFYHTHLSTLNVFSGILLMISFRASAASAG